MTNELKVNMIILEIDDIVKHIIILILHLSICDVSDVRAGSHGKPFDPS